MDILASNNHSLKTLMEAAGFDAGDVAEIAPFDQKDIENFLKGTTCLDEEKFIILQKILEKHLPSKNDSPQAVIKKMGKRKAGI